MISAYRKGFIVLILTFLSTTFVAAQEVGLSFSYFIPKNGYFSTPISPFSLRGIGVDLNPYIALQTGFSLYRMSGLNVKDFEKFETKDPIIGPNFTVLVPAELVLQYGNQRQEIRIKGGGFGFITFDNKLDKGNLNKAIMAYEGWVAVSSDFDMKPKPGYGLFFGAEYIISVTRQWGLSLEANYYLGGADMPLSGSYRGAPENGQVTASQDVNFDNTKIDFTGLEISIGILLQ